MVSALAAHCLPMLFAAALPWQALPEGRGTDGRLEAAILTPDVRTACAAWDKTRRVMAEIPPGQALLARAPGLSRTPCTTALAYLTPQGAPVPAAMALLTLDDQFGIVGAMQVEAGFLERLRRSPPPGWQLEVDGDTFSLQHQHVRWVGQVSKDGWVRISDDVRWLSHALRADPWVSEALQSRLEGSDVAVVIAGDGTLAARMAQLIPQPGLANLAAATRHMAFAWQTDGDKTGLWRAFAEADFLRAWPKAQPQGSVAKEVDGRAQGFAAIQLPEDWPELLPMLLQNASAIAPLRDAPDAFVEAVAKLRGRLCWIDFGVPGDGALLAQADTPDHAQALIPALRDWAKSHGGSLLTGAAQNFAMESVPNANGPALHMQPERGVEGPWLAARDKRVHFVQQRARLQHLLTANKPANTLLRGPLTPMMRTLLAQEAPLQIYWVLGGNGTWLDYLVWGTGHARKSWEQASFWGPIKGALPQILASGSYLWQRTYDMAMTADVSDSVLEIQLGMSEI